MTRVFELVSRALELSLWSGLVLLSGCGPEGGGPSVAAGGYVLDRAAYATALEHARMPPRAASDPKPDEDALERRAAVVRASREAARAVNLRLQLDAHGGFVVRYRFGKERGQRRGVWTQAGDQLTMRITHDAAGPVQRGAAVTATIAPAGLRLSGWPVPHELLLRPE